MEISLDQEHVYAIALPLEDCGSFQNKGIRQREWGKWVSQVRMLRSQEKIWLGSYTTPNQTARDYDAAVYCVRGPNSKFKCPNSVPLIPSASSLSRWQIQIAAAKYALDEIPSISPSLHCDQVREDAARSSSCGKGCYAFGGAEALW